MNRDRIVVDDHVLRAGTGITRDIGAVASRILAGLVEAP